MDHELSKTFNAEVERYKNSLLFYAKKCDWDTFKVNAGRFFDYLESIEISEIENKFFRISWIIVAILFLVCVFVLRMHIDTSPDIINFRKAITLIALCGGSFEIYFYSNFKMYMKKKSSYYKKRKEKFIRDMENDFKDFVIQIST